MIKAGTAVAGLRRRRSTATQVPATPRSIEASAADMRAGRRAPMKSADGLRMSHRSTPPGPLAAGGLRVTALGGIGEIGRNMTVFEHLGRLLIIDCGVLFPNHDEPGVDLILPDLRHVEDRLDEVEALVITHAHEDHIGAIPHLLKLRSDIPIVGSKFTLGLDCREVPRTPHQAGVRRGRRGAAQPRTGYSSVSTSRSTTPSRTRWRSPCTPARARCCTPATSSSTSCRSTAGPPTCRGCRGSVTPGSTCSCVTPRTPRSRASVRRRARSGRTCTA